jgi:selenobiotic family peptide radical SAM maturase
MNSVLPQDQGQKSSGRQRFWNGLETIYPKCRVTVDSNMWRRIVGMCPQDTEPETFPNLIALQRDELDAPAYLAELARLEWAVHQVKTAGPNIPPEVDELVPNPCLQLLQLSWKHLCSFFDGTGGPPFTPPEPGEEMVLVWREPVNGKTRAAAASQEDLLVLKIVVEGMDPEDVAKTGGLPVGAVDAAIRRAASRGVLLAPRSQIRRHPADFPTAEHSEERFVSSPFFTLQWHVTQACDLHCKHCYDRTDRSPLRLDQGLRILDDLRNFCKDRHVRGQVSFTGGNPLLYPHFHELYRAAVDRGLVVAILGNPASRKQMEQLLAIQRPVFFQVSLEGLEQHNDDIRGTGHFHRVMGFLRLLQDLNISSKVMLTLTEGNTDQVLPLGELLRDLTDDFTFNRLSMVGQGAALRLPSPENFEVFLKAYVEASKNNPIMGWKDNFINILCEEKGKEPFGGCTGYGCGAAFNFMAVLSDGKVHACRKFPSPIGNLFTQSMSEIYDSDIARRYRRGPRACRSCPMHLVCRGCLAVAYSHGLDVFEQRDPYCFGSFS